MYRVPYPRQSSLWRADGTRKQFSVYIMSNKSMTLYTGVTNNLARRAADHKNGIGCEFTSRYTFDRLVFFETFDLVIDANRAREINQGNAPCAEDRNDQVEQPEVARSF